MEQLNYALTLASASPRRQAFLQDLGFDFSLMPVDVDESPLPKRTADPAGAAAGGEQGARRGGAAGRGRRAAPDCGRGYGCGAGGRDLRQAV